jgi:hypothetical protein
LVDTSRHIYYNLTHRIGGRGFNNLKELKFVADNEYNKEKFILFFKQAINYCNRGQFKKRKKYAIEEWDFDTINK